MPPSEPSTEDKEITQDFFFVRALSFTAAEGQVKKEGTEQCECYLFNDNPEKHAKANSEKPKWTARHHIFQSAETKKKTIEYRLTCHPFELPDCFFFVVVNSLKTTSLKLYVAGYESVVSEVKSI